jgi:mycofactocin precursor
MNDSDTLTADQVAADAPQFEQTQSEQTQSEQQVDDLVEGDDLVEEVSIDGMCGVY